MSMNGPTLSAFGDVGGNGATDLVVWSGGPETGESGDVLEVYGLSPSRPPQMLADLVVSGSQRSTVSSRSSLVVADVDPSVTGNEIILGTDDTASGRTRLRIFGGLADGSLHLLCQWHPIGRRAPHQRLAGFAVGDVLPDAQHAANEIVAGGSNGVVRIYGIDGERVNLVRTLNAFPDSPGVSAERLVVANLLPEQSGDEIAVGDDGTRGDSLVRVLDPRRGVLLLEFRAFANGKAPDGVELWAGDILSAYPGPELIVGQGSAGGQLRVFTLASGVPAHVADVPDPFHRTTTLLHRVSIGDVFPDLRGNELVVAQSDPLFPVQIFHFESLSEPVSRSIAVAAEGGVISAVEVGR